ncbi:MAG: hypothetical protein K2W82_17635 [Candidatus Obscuribacterales bacterium]|jgi:hypothetical protein|nr:hypothetical protein [Candidatus Obscuribacterales bacterium]
MNQNREPQDFGTFTCGNREIKPLDKERAWGIVAVVFTIAAFATVANTTGITQTVAGVAAIFSFISVFALMSKSIDKQNEERWRRKRR